MPARHKLLAHYIVFGTDHPRAVRLNLPLNTPLPIELAADVVGLRRKFARRLMTEPAMQRLILQLNAILRNGFKSKAINKMGELIDWQGEGTAADGSLALRASQAILGEEATKGTTVNVAVQTNVGTADRPRAGYVIRLDRSRAAQQSVTAQTIEGQANDVPASEPKT